MKAAILVSSLLFLGCGAPRKAPDFDFPPIRVKARPASPIYPQEALKTNVDGTVIVEVFIDKDGFPVNAKAISGPSLLFKQAEANALRWVFYPATVNGEPITARFNIKVKFVLPK